VVCPKIDKICRDCHWNKPDSNENLDICKHPKVFSQRQKKRFDREATCYITGNSELKSVNEPKIRLSEFCSCLRVSFDNGYYIPGTDICGKDGFWFKPKSGGR